MTTMKEIEEKATAYAKSVSQDETYQLQLKLAYLQGYVASAKNEPIIEDLAPVRNKRLALVSANRACEKCRDGKMFHTGWIIHEKSPKYEIQCNTCLDKVFTTEANAY